MTRTTTLLLVLSIALSASATQKPTQLGMSVGDVAKLLEGLVYGILEQSLGDFSSCIADSKTIEQEVVTAVADFEKETFEGVKDGLSEMGKVISALPTFLKECSSSIQSELDTISKMGSVFTNPWKLAFTVGKNLIVNGVDIYKKIYNAVASYKSGDYYNFGKYIGEALHEVVYGNGEDGSKTKNSYETNSYEFLSGYFQALNVAYDQQALYNGVNGIGYSMYGPIEATMNEYIANGASTKFWMDLHEVQHIFQEGGQSLVALNVISASDSEIVKANSDCMEQSNLTEQNSLETNVLFKSGVASYQSGNIKEFGMYFAQASESLCAKTEQTFLH